MNSLTLKTTGEVDVMADSAGRMTISIPYQIKRRSGRKLVQLPSGETLTPKEMQSEATPMQQALVRGHRWLGMLESGEVKNLSEIALKEGVDNSYISRMVNLTTLAPQIVTAILDETLPDNITLFELAVNPPMLWDEQCKRIE
jgi:hypothetical protein